MAGRVGFFLGVAGAGGDTHRDLWLWNCPGRLVLRGPVSSLHAPCPAGVRAVKKMIEVWARHERGRVSPRCC